MNVYKITIWPISGTIFNVPEILRVVARDEIAAKSFLYDDVSWKNHLNNNSSFIEIEKERRLSE